MTTIAWDGETLAADRLGTSDGSRNAICKLFDCGDYYYGAVGSLAEAVLITEWLLAGAPPDQRLMFDANEVYGLVVRKADAKVYKLQGKIVVLTETRERKVATGSGFEYARMAMHLGKTAPQAVRLAAKFDVATGLGVDADRVRKAKKA